MLPLSETESIEKEARLAAGQENVQFVMQPFDGPANWEFRREAADGVECLGLLYGPAELVLFRRHLSLRHVWFRERLWWLGFLVGRKSSDVYYQEIGRIKRSEVKRDMLAQLIRDHFRSLPSPSNRGRVSTYNK